MFYSLNSQLANATTQRSQATNSSCKIECAAQNREMCSDVPTKPTSDFDIDYLHTIKQRYKQIGHPNQNNIQLWRDHLVGFQGEDSHIYAMANDLKKDTARSDLITPVKAVSSSSSSSIALSMSSSASSYTSEKDKRSAII